MCVSICLMIIEPGTRQVTLGHIFSLSLDPKYRTSVSLWYYMHLSVYKNSDIKLRYDGRRFIKSFPLKIPEKRMYFCGKTAKSVKTHLVAMAIKLY